MRNRCDGIYAKFIGENKLEYEKVINIKSKRTFVLY